MVHQNSIIRTALARVTVASMATLYATTAQAADGCKFLLCIAGPWTSIAACVPTVREVFRDLALGRAFPTCAMSGAGNGAGNQWLGESTCPAMYRQYDNYNGGFVMCSYRGRITVNINGALWSQVYWDFGGNISTWYSDQARTSLSQPGSAPLDDTFDTDMARWNRPNVSGCSSQGGTPVFDVYGAFERCAMPDSGGGA